MGYQTEHITTDPIDIKRISEYLYANTLVNLNKIIAIPWKSQIFIAHLI